MEGGHNDDEALKPHPDIHEDRHGEENGNARPRLLEPENLGREHVAGDHGPIGPGVVSKGAVDEGEGLVVIARVPGDEELHAVGVTDQ